MTISTYSVWTYLIKWFLWKLLNCYPVQTLFLMITSFWRRWSSCWLGETIGYSWIVTIMIKKIIYSDGIYFRHIYIMTFTNKKYLLDMWRTYFDCAWESFYWHCQCHYVEILKKLPRFFFLLNIFGECPVWNWSQHHAVGALRFHHDVWG